MLNEPSYLFSKKKKKNLVIIIIIDMKGFKVTSSAYNN